MVILIQIFKKYLGRLVKGIFSRRALACFDMTMCLTPAYFISISAVVINVVMTAVLLILGVPPIPILLSLVRMVLAAYAMLFIFSVCVTVSDWKRLRASAFKKILYMFTFPVFIFFFIPPAFVALFKKVEWKAIRHGTKK